MNYRRAVPVKWRGPGIDQMANAIVTLVRAIDRGRPGWLALRRGFGKAKAERIATFTFRPLSSSRS